MGKLDALLKDSGNNIAESMGAGRGKTQTVVATSSAPARWQGVAKAKNAIEVPLAKIERDPNQPREQFDEEALERLATSLKRRGVLQPVVVRWNEERKAYRLVAGERRWRAAQRADLPTLPCIVMDGEISPSELLSIQIVENALREDLKPIEQAKGYRALMEANDWTVRQVADELSIDHSSVVRALALLKLPEPVQERVEQGTLPPSTAYEISKAAPAEQAELASRVVAERLTTKDVVKAVRSSPSTSKGRGAAKKKITERVIRTNTGPRIMIEFKKGLTPELVRAALAEALSLVDGEVAGRSDAA